MFCVTPAPFAETLRRHQWLLPIYANRTGPQPAIPVSKRACFDSPTLAEDDIATSKANDTTNADLTSRAATLSHRKANTSLISFGWRYRHRLNLRLASVAVVSHHCHLLNCE